MTRLILFSIIFSILTSCGSEEKNGKLLGPKKNSENLNNSSKVEFDGATSIDNITGTSATIHWVSQAEIHSYILIDMSGTEPLVKKVLDGSLSSYTISDLEMEKNYSFQVHGLDINGKIASNSKQVSITTLSSEIPDTIMGNKLWLRADNVDGSNNSTITDGDLISNWNDHKQNAVTVEQVNSNSQPKVVNSVLNGKPVVRFDGDDDYMAGIFDSVMPSESTIFIVGQFSQLTQPNGDFDYMINFGTASDGANSNLSISRTAGNWSIGNIFYNYSGSSVLKGPELTGQSWKLFTMSINSISPFSSLFINGQSQTVDDYSMAPSLGASFELGRYPLNNHYLNGDIAEVIVYDSKISLSDQQKVQCYLASKYGLVVDHVCN